MKLRSLIPYRVRLWWAMRRVPTCTCENEAKRPELHAKDCPVWTTYVNPPSV